MKEGLIISSKSSYHLAMFLNWLEATSKTFSLSSEKKDAIFMVSIKKTILHSIMVLTCVRDLLEV